MANRLYSFAGTKLSICGTMNVGYRPFCTTKFKNVISYDNNKSDSIEKSIDQIVQMLIMVPARMVIRVNRVQDCGVVQIEHNFEANDEFVQEQIETLIKIGTRLHLNANVNINSKCIAVDDMVRINFFSYKTYIEDFILKDCFKESLEAQLETFIQEYSKECIPECTQAIMREHTNTNEFNLSEANDKIQRVMKYVARFVKLLNRFENSQKVLLEAFKRESDFGPKIFGANISSDKIRNLLEKIDPERITDFNEGQRIHIEGEDFSFSIGLEEEMQGKKIVPINYYAKSLYAKTTRACIDATVKC